MRSKDHLFSYFTDSVNKQYLMTELDHEECTHYNKQVHGQVTAGT